MSYVKGLSAVSVNSFRAGQPVHEPVHGNGEVVTTKDNKVIVRFGKKGTPPVHVEPTALIHGHRK